MPTLREITINDFEAEAMPHLNELYRTALKFTKNQTEAEDLIQEVFLQAWKSFRCYELRTNCRAWLHKILSNKLKRFYSNKGIRHNGAIFYSSVFNAIVSPSITSRK